MQVFRKTGVAALGCVLAFSSCALAGQIVSSMGNVNRAVMSVRGFYLTPAPDASGQRYPGDLAPTQAFELVRPHGEKITVGRINTSCVCVQLTTAKRTYEKGERAIFELRNVRATPPGGQNYAVYVQLTSPIRATLRFDTFVRSDFGNPESGVALPEPVVVATPAKPVAASLPEAGQEQARQTVSPDESGKPAEPTPPAHPYMTVDGMELIIPRWDPEADGEGAASPKPQAPVEKAEPAAPAADIVYSKEIKEDSAVPEAPATYSKEIKAEEPAARPEAKPSEPVGETSVKPEAAEAPVARSEVKAAATRQDEADEFEARSTEEVEKIVDKYISTYRPKEGDAD